ncbi:MAG: hypothetical protein H8E62_03040 [Planctomycetes bacterium]|nr:hypothetical protein [Planctomycetota bacterium]
MEQGYVLQKRKLTWGLLFVGFCCVFGWIGTNFILLRYFTNSGHFESFATTLQTTLRNLFSSSFYAIIGMAAFVLGLRRFRRTEKKKSLIAWSLIPAAVLTPALAVGGIIVIMLAPFVYAHARTLVAGPNIVQSVDSSNKAYQAYVVDKPSIDGPNHHLYVKDIVTGKSTFVSNLPEDVDFNEEILWSPFNDLVVFRTYFKLIIYSSENGKAKEVKLGGDYHWRDNGTFWVDYKDVKKPINLQFPEPDAFSYQFEGDETSYRIDMNKI